MTATTPLMLMLPHPLVAEILAGMSAGAVKTFAFYPLDTLTTLREVGVAQQSCTAGALDPLGQLRVWYAGCALAVFSIVPYALLFHTAFYYSEAALTRAAAPLALAKVCAGA